MRAVFDVAHALARDVHFGKPLQLDELYHLVIVIRSQIQRLPA